MLFKKLLYSYKLCFDVIKYHWCACVDTVFIKCSTTGCSYSWLYYNYLLILFKALLLLIIYKPIDWSHRYLIVMFLYFINQLLIRQIYKIQLYKMLANNKKKILREFSQYTFICIYSENLKRFVNTYYIYLNS